MGSAHSTTEQNILHNRRFIRRRRIGSYSAQNIEEWNQWGYHQTLPHGIANSGNSCYMNAAIQFLLAARPIVFTLGCTGSILQRHSRSDFIHLLVRLVQLMLYANVGYVNAYRFRVVAARDHPVFSRYGQEDSLEYFMHLLTTLQDNFPPELADKNPCDKLMIELCEQIEKRGENKETKYVRREELVLSCPLHDLEEEDEELKTLPEAVSDNRRTRQESPSEHAYPREQVSHVYEAQAHNYTDSRGLTLHKEELNSLGQPHPSSSHINHPGTVSTTRHSENFNQGVTSYAAQIPVEYTGNELVNYQDTGPPGKDRYDHQVALQQSNDSSTSDEPCQGCCPSPSNHHINKRTAPAPPSSSLSENKKPSSSNRRDKTFAKKKKVPTATLR